MFSGEELADELLHTASSKPRAMPMLVNAAALPFLPVQLRSPQLLASCECVTGRLHAVCCYSCRALKRHC
jgi:hypothetical protein